MKKFTVTGSVALSTLILASQTSPLMIMCAAASDLSGIELPTGQNSVYYGVPSNIPSYEYNFELPSFIEIRDVDMAEIVDTDGTRTPLTNGRIMVSSRQSIECKSGGHITFATANGTLYKLQQNSEIEIIGASTFAKNSAFRTEMKSGAIIVLAAEKDTSDRDIQDIMIRTSQNEAAHNRVVLNDADVVIDTDNDLVACMSGAAIVEKDGLWKPIAVGQKSHFRSTSIGVDNITEKDTVNGAVGGFLSDKGIKVEDIAHGSKTQDFATRINQLQQDYIPKTTAPAAQSSESATQPALPKDTAVVSPQANAPETSNVEEKGKQNSKAEVKDNDKKEKSTESSQSASGDQSSDSSQNARRTYSSSSNRSNRGSGNKEYVPSSNTVVAETPVVPDETVIDSAVPDDSAIPDDSTVPDDSAIPDDSAVPDDSAILDGTAEESVPGTNEATDVPDTSDYDLLHTGSEQEDNPDEPTSSNEDAQVVDIPRDESLYVVSNAGSNA